MEVPSADVLPHGSGKGCCLFGHGDHLGSGLGDKDAERCSPIGGAMTGGADGGDRVIVLTMCGRRWPDSP